MLIDRMCLYCASGFQETKKRVDSGRGKYCSRQCFYDDKKRLNRSKRVECVCEECDKRFTVIKSRFKDGRGRFCSRSCKDKPIKRNGIPNANKFPKGEKPLNYKGRIYKDGKNKKSYILIHKPNHPSATSQGYVREHRLVMEKHLGRRLTEDEVVHHIDGNKQNNKIDNLQVMSNADHSAMHAKMRKDVMPQ